MQLTLEFKDGPFDVTGVFSIEFGDKFYITRSSKIREWAAKILDDVNAALKPGVDYSKLPSRKIIQHVKENNISVAYVSLAMEATNETVAHTLQELLSGNDGNPMCLNVAFTKGIRGNGNTKPHDPDKKKWIPWKQINEKRQNQ